MTELKIFEHPKFGKIRTITEDGKLMFCGSDTAKALEYAKPQNAIAVHCKGALKRSILTNGGVQEMLFIPEGDLCRLAASSKLPGASEFEHWIFDEVIPTVLRTGTYTMPGAVPPPHVPPEVSPGGLARLISTTRRVMLDAGRTPVDVEVMMHGVYRMYNFPMQDIFKNQIPGQISFFDLPGQSWGAA